MNVYQVQAQLTGTRDGWESSRQVDTMWVAAPDEGSAVRMVSNVAWNMSGGGYADRRTFATVVEVRSGDDGTWCQVSPVRWVRVDYLPGGYIATIVRSTYAEVREG